MAKHSYIENADEAWCSECGFRCTPDCDDGVFGHDGVPGGLHSYGEEWSSHCCSSAIIDGDDRPWVADVVEGSPEP